MVGVLGQSITLVDCPKELRPFMMELGAIGRQAKELQEEDRIMRSGEKSCPPLEWTMSGLYSSKVLGTDNVEILLRGEGALKVGLWRLLIG